MDKKIVRSSFVFVIFALFVDFLCHNQWNSFFINKSIKHKTILNIQISLLRKHSICYSVYLPI